MKNECNRMIANVIRLKNFERYDMIEVYEKSGAW